MRLQSKKIEVFADYHQFYLWDRDTNPEAPVDYIDEDVLRRIKTGPNVVVIQPERNMEVPVEVEVHDADPGYIPDEWDHIAEASLHLPTGHLQVHECTGDAVADFEETRDGIAPARSTVGSIRLPSMVLKVRIITRWCCGRPHHLML
jgi:hypothetical protein